MKNYIKSFNEPKFGSETKDWDKVNYKERRNNGLTIFTGPSNPHLTKISAEEWNDVIYYIEDLEERIESLEKRVGE